MEESTFEEPIVDLERRIEALSGVGDDAGDALTVAEEAGGHGRGDERGAGLDSHLGQTYTFKVRDGIKFHSGNPLTAEDAAASVDFTACMVSDEGACRIWWLAGYRDNVREERREAGG